MRRTDSRRTESCRISRRSYYNDHNMDEDKLLTDRQRLEGGFLNNFPSREFVNLVFED